MLTGYLFFWARRVLRRRNPRIVGVTGSVGKTTTKEMIAAVLMHEEARPIVGLVWKSPGNLNNNIGLPLTILGYHDWPASRLAWIATLCTLPFRSQSLAASDAYPRILVLEYAAGWRGDVDRLAALAPPTVAVVTAVGPAHLERFKTVECLAHVKGALVRAVPRSGLVVLGQDNSYASDMARHARAPVVKVRGTGRELSQNLAHAVARYFRLPDEVVTAALSACDALAGRLRVLELGYVLVIDDAFNANPLSMKLGLDTLAEAAEQKQRKVAILGMMAELGIESRKYHEEIAAYARQRADCVIGVGSLAKAYRPDHWFAGSEDCARGLRALIRRGDCLLVKGSHSVHLSRVVVELKRIAAEAPVP
jgi:UDP-N-acetylmuramoyl-tripeptide--D-alanyl-D-alanine ligase